MDPMHDDRELVEERITRELAERVLPLVHPQRRPLTVEAGPSLDDARAVHRRRRAGARRGARRGSGSRGEVPASWSGRRVEALLDLGFRLDAPGFQCEGLVRDGKGRPVQGIHPRRQAVAGARRGRTRSSCVVEAASNPTFPQFRPSPLGSPATAGDRPLYRLDRAELVARRRRRRGARPRPRRPRRGDAHARPRRPPPGADAGRRRPGARRAGAAAGRRRRPGGRRQGGARAESRAARSAPRRIESSPPGMPTSTRRGCGRCPRRSASARARSPRRWR